MILGKRVRLVKNSVLRPTDCKHLGPRKQLGGEVEQWKSSQNGSSLAGIKFLRDPSLFDSQEIQCLHMNDCIYEVKIQCFQKQSV